LEEFGNRERLGVFLLRLRNSRINIQRYVKQASSGFPTQQTQAGKGFPA
jgi:hypothetical protein